MKCHYNGTHTQNRDPKVVIVDAPGRQGGRKMLVFVQNEAVIFVQLFVHLLAPKQVIRSPPRGVVYLTTP